MFLSETKKAGLLLKAYLSEKSQIIPAPGDSVRIRSVQELQALMKVLNAPLVGEISSLTLLSDHESIHKRYCGLYTIRGIIHAKPTLTQQGILDSEKLRIHIEFGFRNMFWWRLIKVRKEHVQLALFD